MRVATLSILLIISCAASPPARLVHHEVFVAGESGVVLPPGDPVEGRAAFAKLRCDVCHSVAFERRGAPHPLRDLSGEPAEAVAAMIMSRTKLPPEALFDEMAMSAAASRITTRELSHIVSYLRQPPAAGVR